MRRADTTTEFVVMCEASTRAELRVQRALTVERTSVETGPSGFRNSEGCEVCCLALEAVGQDFGSRTHTSWTVLRWMSLNGLNNTSWRSVVWYVIEDWSYLAVESAFCALFHWYKAISPTSPVSVPWVWRGGWRCGCDHVSDSDPSCPKPQ